MLRITAQNEFLTPASHACACPDDVLIFNCTVVGGTVTVWSGSAFTCERDEIILVHNHFRSRKIVQSACDDTITARSIAVENNNCYMSQLSVNVSNEMNNKTILCLGNSSNIVGETTLTVISSRLGNFTL